MRYDILLSGGVLVLCMAMAAGCSLGRGAVDEATARGEIRLELAGEANGRTDAAIVLKQALRDVEAVAPEERGDFLAAAIERADEARWFEIKTEAPLPEGWPRPTLPGLIRIKTYPPVRTAWARGDNAEKSQFMTLFRHINNRDIAMTAPVVMEYESAATAPEGPGRTGGMAFLYRRVGQDEAGQFGPVAVGDEKPLQVVSVGVKGAYMEGKFRKAFAELYEWLDAHPQWRPAGMPRVLGYNSPFMLFWMKYSEVQIPVAWTQGDEVGKGVSR